MIPLNQLGQPPNPGLNVCPLNALAFTECDTNHYKVTGSILTAGTVNFAPAVTQPFWALGFSSLGNSYPYLTNIEQAYYYSSLQVYPSDLSQLSAVEAQFNDAYETPSGLVQTKWTITFNPTAQTITVGNLMTKLPGQGWRACTEILLAFWRMDVFNFPVAPQEIILPYS